MRTLRRKAYSYRRGSIFEIMKKLYLSKAFLKMAGGEMHPPHPPWIRP